MLSAVLSRFVCGGGVWVLVFTSSRFISVISCFHFSCPQLEISQIIVFPVEIHQDFAALRDKIWPLPGANEKIFSLLWSLIIMLNLRDWGFSHYALSPAHILRKTGPRFFFREGIAPSSGRCGNSTALSPTSVRWLLKPKPTDINSVFRAHDTGIIFLKTVLFFFFFLFNESIHRHPWLLVLTSTQSLFRFFSFARVEIMPFVSVPFSPSPLGESSLAVACSHRRVMDFPGSAEPGSVLPKRTSCERASRAESTGSLVCSVGGCGDRETSFVFSLICGSLGTSASWLFLCYLICKSFMCVRTGNLKLKD